MELDRTQIRQKDAVCDTASNGRILNCDHSSRNFRLLPFRQPAGARKVTVLSQLKVGESAVLVSLDLRESVQNHLMHMGFVPDALVKVLRRAPAGDPTVYGIDGMEIALRHETAESIRVREPEAAGAAPESSVAEEPELIEASR
jgi:ferrous iron transport protein A